MNVKWNIQRKFAVMFVSMAVIPLVAVSMLLLEGIRDSLLHEIGTKYTSLAEDRAEPT
ncbi:MAG: hypothetical protein ABI341_04540 [Nitrososphaera sp.]|jgi:hypothetical protein